MARIAVSKNGVPVRLTEERWFHITEHHDDLAGYAPAILEVIEEPDFVAEGWEDELVAVKRVGQKHLAVVYREVTRADGFVITAFFTRKAHKWAQRKRRWPK